MSRRLKRINKALLPMYRTGGKYLCPFCPKKYHFKHSLKDHINTHTGSQPHVCKHCRRTFSHLASLCTHIKRCHYSQISQEFQCDICKERFLNRQSLKQHFTWRHRKGSSDSAAQQTTTPAGANATERAEAGGDVSQQLMEETSEANGCPAREEPPEQTRETSEQMAKTSTAASGSAQFVYQNNNPQDIATDMAIARHGVDVARAVVMSSSSGVTPMVTSPSLYSQPPPMSLPSMSSPLIDYGQFAHCLMTAPPSSMAQFYQQATAPPSFMPGPAAPVVSLPAPVTFERTIDGKFQCPYCVKTYNFKHTLKDHINKHMGKRPHVCKHCGDTFTHLASLCAHIKRRHAEHMPNDYKCEICHDKFMNYQSLKQHHTWRHRDRKPPLLNVSAAPAALTPSPAVVAPPTHTRASALALPSVGAFMSTVLTSPPLSSPAVRATQQQNVFPGATALPMTSTAMSGVLPPPSVTPSSVPNHAETLAPTVKIETPDFDPCTLPTHDLMSPGSDAKNRLDYPSADEQASDAGGGGDNAEASAGQQSPSGSIMSYFEEINYQTEYGLYRYKCRLCSNVFKIKNSLYEHVNSHLGKKPHVCSVCGVAFTHHSSLHNHMRNKHTFHSRQEKEAQCKIQCPTCGRKFRYPSELDRHFNYNPDHDRPGAAVTPGGTSVESPETYLSGDMIHQEKSSPSQPQDCLSKEQFTD